MTELSHSPFEDNVVFEPREAEPAIPGVNEGPLRQVLEVFARLETEPCPRRRPVRAKAQLVISAEPGYGKSHLIGRLFAALEDRALPVYLRPFEDPRASWRSILVKLVAELLLRAGNTRASPLAVFAGDLLGGLLRRLMANSTLAGEEAEFWAERLRTDPRTTLGLVPSADPDAGAFAAWLRAEGSGALLGECARLVEGDGVSLHAPTHVWLRILLGAAGSAGTITSTAERGVCLDWLRGGNLAPEDARRLGLPASAFPDSDGADVGRAAARNVLAWERLQDWFALAGYVRPFLLCFDQTELMTRDGRLATEFGAVVESLVQCGLNVLTVVTANAEPWERAIRPNIEVALQARFSAPIEMEGLNRAGAETLARRRLGGAGASELEIARFCNRAWLDGFFRDSPRESPRRFLDECARRWRELASLPPPETPTLPAWLARARAGLEARGTLPAFDADVLRWAVGPELVGDVLAAEGLTPGQTRDAAGVVTLRWKLGPGGAERVFFGFEAESGWQRWRALLKRAERLTVRFRQRGGSARCVFLRTPEQPVIPGSGWVAMRPRFEAAMSAGALALQVLDREEWAKVLAAYELWAGVMEGTAPFGREETLAFLRGELTPWWRELGKASPA